MHFPSAATPTWEHNEGSSRSRRHSDDENAEPSRSPQFEKSPRVDNRAVEDTEARDYVWG